MYDDRMLDNVETRREILFPGKWRELDELSKIKAGDGSKICADVGTSATRSDSNDNGVSRGASVNDEPASVTEEKPEIRPIDDYAQVRASVPVDDDEGDEAAHQVLSGDIALVADGNGGDLANNGGTTSQSTDAAEIDVRSDADEFDDRNEETSRIDDQSSPPAASCTDVFPGASGYSDESDDDSGRQWFW